MQNTETCNHISTDTGQPRAFSNAWFVICGECDKELSDGFNSRIEAMAAETMFWTMQDDKRKPEPKCGSEVDAEVGCGLEKDHEGDCVQIGVSWDDVADTVTPDAVGTCERLVRVRGECELPATAGHDGKPCYSGRLTCTDPEDVYPAHRYQYTITPLPATGRYRVNGGVSMDDYWTFNTYDESLAWIAKSKGELVLAEPEDADEDDPIWEDTTQVRVFFERKDGKVQAVTARSGDDELDPTETIRDLDIEDAVMVTIDVPLDVLMDMEATVPTWELEWCAAPEHVE